MPVITGPDRLAPRLTLHSPATRLVRRNRRVSAVPEIVVRAAPFCRESAHVVEPRHRRGRGVRGGPSTLGRRVTGRWTGKRVIRMDKANPTSWIDLYWLPLGAGGHCVRLNGRVYERITALREHRRPGALFHSALQLHLDEITYAIEMGPVWNVDACDRGAICQGPVGMRWLGRFRAFQYEVRCWPGGSIPDIAEAVASPLRVSTERRKVSAVLDVVRQVPALIWGRDELHCGDMWNSNSLVSWALARTAHDVGAIRPPLGGRAPGWRTGLALAEREQTTIRARTSAADLI